METISLGREEAIRRYESKWWTGESKLNIAITQLQIEELIVEWGVFREAIEYALGRPVFTREFAGEGRERMFEEITKGRARQC